jgi:hypothetical protein
MPSLRVRGHGHTPHELPACDRKNRPFCGCTRRALGRTRKVAARASSTLERWNRVVACPPRAAHPGTRRARRGVIGRSEFLRLSRAARMRLLELTIGEGSARGIGVRTATRAGDWGSGRGLRTWLPGGCTKVCMAWPPDCLSSREQHRARAATLHQHAHAATSVAASRR